MDPHPLLTSLESDASVFHSVAATTLGRDDDPDVPCCPGWTLSRLLQHLGSIHSLVAEWVTVGRRPDVWDSAPDDDPIGWLARCSARLLDAVGTVDPETPCSTWSPYDQSVGFWVRRMAHETVAHRVDLEQSLGMQWTIDEVVALDGIDEALTLWLGSTIPAGLTGGGHSVRVLDRVIRPYDTLLHFSSYEPGMPVDATVTGSAEAVWAWCWGRTDAAHPVEIDGDAGAAAELRAILAAAQQ